MPAPFGPITATSSPGPAASETSRSASRLPKRFERPVASSTGLAWAPGRVVTVAASSGIRATVDGLE